MYFDHVLPIFNSLYIFFTSFPTQYYLFLSLFVSFSFFFSIKNKKQK